MTASLQHTGRGGAIFGPVGCSRASVAVADWKRTGHRSAASGGQAVQENHLDLPALPACEAFEGHAGVSEFLRAPSHASKQAARVFFIRFSPSPFAQIAHVGEYSVRSGQGVVKE
jgi:hypothetical protein